MDAPQRRVIGTALSLIAVILFGFYFAKPLWAWMTWDPKQGSLDLGFVKFTTRPPFPNDAKSVGLGLVVPIVLIAAGRLAESRQRYS